MSSGSDHLTSSPDEASAPEGLIEVLESDDLLGIGAGTAILIADDDATNRVAYEAALGPLGREVVVVSSGIEALATLLDRDVALILLDVQMPEMNGIETARMLRRRPKNKGTPIIFITGMASDNDVMREAYQLGAFDFVIKPIEPDILRAKVRLYLQLQDRTRDVQRKRKELRDARQQLEAEKESRERVHAADAAVARRLEKLQEATAGLAEARTPDQVASVAVRLGAEAVEAETAVMWLVREDQTLTVAGSHAAPSSYLGKWPVLGPDAKHPVRRVLDRRQPLWVETAEDYERDAPEILDAARAMDKVVAFASLPLVPEGKALGVLSFAFAENHKFTDEERRFLTALVRSCEQALERSRLYVAEAEARKRAEAGNARKDEFLAMLGHELRNPLASIVSALEVLKLRGEPFGREMAVVDRQVHHLGHLVHELVDSSRLTQGKITLDRTAVSLADTIQDAIDAVRSSIDSRHHQLRVTVPRNLLVDADRDRLCQVMANLLSNASKYTPNEGLIEISARADGAFVEITVRDNGIGITPSLLPNVFDIFVQGERNLARREGGLGVGLSIVRSIVELHGGSVAARSDGAGTGATFTVRWPKASSATPTSEVPPLDHPASDKVVILIVDDNEDAADLLAALAHELGHETVVAHDAQTALGLVASGVQPDVALLDIGLPDMNGYDLVRELRANPRCAHTLMVAVTGYSQKDDRARAEKAGFDRHFAKPIEVAELTALLRTVQRRSAT